LGDVILEVDGRPVPQLIQEWTPFYADSNEAARQRDIANFMLRGACGPTKLRVRRGAEELTIETSRIAAQPPEASTHDLPGDTFRLLTPEVAYLKLSSVKAADIPNYLKSSEGTKGWIIDIRNYPSEFMPFALGSHLVKEPTPFVYFTALDLANPGAFRWREPGPLVITPEAPRYPGKVVVLVDETTQSQAEYTSMAFRAAGATIVGSTTAGADGNVSQISLPGGLSTMFSGIGVFYPDKSPTQQVGIVPDIVVRPTIPSLAAGRDELVEAGVRSILGRALTDAEVRALSRR
jgi:C-terminal processing protease CtpA/Prc